MRKILIVEDKLDISELLVIRLQQRGFLPVCAANGREGVDMAEKERPDLILMDLDMPVMNGWDATKKLKGSSSASGIPVIALTAHFSALDRDEEYEAGAEAFVTKPIDFDVLFKKIDEFLR